MARQRPRLAGFRGGILASFTTSLWLLFMTASVYGGPAATENVIITVAGIGSAGFTGDGGPSLLAMLNFPGPIAVDSSGNIYVADLQNQRIRKVSVDGNITTVAGNGQVGFSGDGGQATTAALNLMEPRWTQYLGSVAVDDAGNIYISDTNNNRVRKIGLTGVITTVAGNGERAFAGDGGSAVLASLAGPGGLAIDSQGNLLIADTGNNAVRKVSPDGKITTVISDVTNPLAVAVDLLGTIYVTSYEDRVLKAAPSGALVELGTGWNKPWGIAVDVTGNLYVADSRNQRVRRVAADGSVTTVAGIGAPDSQGYVQPGFSGDGGPASNAALAWPLGVAVDKAGNLYIADSGNGRIRRITSEVSGGDPLVLFAAFNRQRVSPGGSFASTFSGLNLTSDTYFDVRFRRPGSDLDEIALNWQKGILQPHQVPIDTLPGVWTINGVSSHQSANDHTASFVSISVSIIINPTAVTGLELISGTVGTESSYVATFAGANLTTDTYFDIRFRAPCSGVDQIALNWQRGLSSAHPVPAGVPPGAWTITGVFAHEDISEQVGHFAPLNAIVVVSGQPATVPLNGQITSLVVAPGSSTTIYAANPNGVYKSCDAGQTWRPASSGLPVPETLTLAIDPQNLDVLYAGTRTAGTFKSVDGAANWTSIRSGLPSAGIRALAIDPRNPLVLYAGIEGGFGVFKSTNGGESWNAANSGLPPSTTIQSLAVDPVASNILYAGTDVIYPTRAQVFKSIDGGNHWESSWLPASSRVDAQTIYALLVDAGNPSIIYAGTDNPERGYNSNQPGVFKSVDGGATWSGSSSGGPNHRFITSLAMSPLQPANIYAGGFYRHSLFKSTNAGASWTGSTIFFAASDNVFPSIRALVADPSNPSILYAGAPEGLFKSANAGSTWQRVGASAP